MELVKIEQCSLNYGEQHLMDNIDLSIRKGQRICLVGRNGTGKSTLLKVIASEVKPDSGNVWRRQGLRIAYLEQDVPVAESLTVYDVVASAFSELGEHLSEFRRLSICVDDDKGLQQLQQVQQKIETADGWLLQQKIDTILSRLDLNADTLMSDLSGGWRRRVLLAKALVIDPELLLLDEPTNHLDIHSIQWLEQQLEGYQGALVIISHDRAFLQRLANHILELDRGTLWSYKGSYQTFLVDKETRLQEEARHNALFDKRLAEEERWIRKGIKARRTRNEGRVRQLKKLREEHQSRRQLQGTSQFTIDKGESSGKVVFEVDDISHRWQADSPWVVRNFSSRILRGDRIGIIGDNGAGKSTLIKLLLDQLQPTMGTIKQGTKLSVAYFDQQRQQLDLEKNAIDNIAGGREFITINDKDIHIITYLRDFLFTGERARTAVGSLSGGERNRILLAKLFSQPSNLLILDEPTNDLDMETLELLEERLLEYQGTVLLVSHDRTFLDNVVTHILAIEGEGQVNYYVGSYSYWKEHFSKVPSKNTIANTKRQVEADSQVTVDKPKKKLSYQLQRELEKLPEDIARQEESIEQYNATIADADFYNQPQDMVAKTLAELAEQQKLLDALYVRWEELENL